ncbi:MAG: methyltransferase [Thermoprotei archaeon]|nr:MAG: methyltransferase [Thermoprotei archaeon]
MAGTWSYVVFCPQRGLALGVPEARRVLSLLERGGGSTAVNIGTCTVRVEPRGSNVRIGSFEVPCAALLEVAEGDEDYVYFLYGDGRVFRVAFHRQERFYKLRFLGEAVAPTLEISGIHMHNIVGTDPWRDAERKVRLARVKGGMRVLDVCTGLGYTAIHSARRGAMVLSIEKDPSVLEVAEYNPWSWPLASLDVTILLGDAVEVLDDLPEATFDAVIHDPPRFSLAGELYSNDFYRKLYKVMKRGSTLFHYTGGPGRHRGMNFQAGVVRRLRKAGFSIVTIIRDYGVVATRP